MQQTEPLTISPSDELAEPILFLASPMHWFHLWEAKYLGRLSATRFEGFGLARLDAHIVFSAEDLESTSEETYSRSVVLFRALSIPSSGVGIAGCA